MDKAAEGVLQIWPVSVWSNCLYRQCCGIRNIPPSFRRDASRTWTTQKAWQTMQFMHPPIWSCVQADAFVRQKQCHHSCQSLLLTHNLLCTFCTVVAAHKWFWSFWHVLWLDLSYHVSTSHVVFMPGNISYFEDQMRQDMQGLSMQIMQVVRMYSKSWQWLGADPTAITPSVLGSATQKQRPRNCVENEIMASGKRGRRESSKRSTVRDRARWANQSCMLWKTRGKVLFAMFAVKSTTAAFTCPQLQQQSLSVQMLADERIKHRSWYLTENRSEVMATGGKGGREDDPGSTVCRSISEMRHAKKKRKGTSCWKTTAAFGCPQLQQQALLMHQRVTHHTHLDCYCLYMVLWLSVHVMPCVSRLSFSTHVTLKMQTMTHQFDYVANRIKSKNPTWFQAHIDVTWLKAAMNYQHRSCNVLRPYMICWKRCQNAAPDLSVTNLKLADNNKRVPFQPEACVYQTAMSVHSHLLTSNLRL